MNNKKTSNSLILFLAICACSLHLTAQDYWQQKINYDIKVKVNDKKNCLDGEMNVTYYNNSSETIDRMFFHLYYNAFQPNSMMDERSRTIPDPDPRVAERIHTLSKKEIGAHTFKKIKQNGNKLNYLVDGTILEVDLKNPIEPGESTTLNISYESLIPVQIRRTGRDNKENVRFSMSQWYPKVCEFDENGWHPNPYIGREFYGVWGDYNVDIEINKNYLVAAGGVLKNDPSKQSGKMRTWSFEANNVHDFVWAADPEYIKEVVMTDDGIEMQFVYQPSDKTSDNWQRLPEIMNEAFDFIQNKYGDYPYPVYAFIQGGDGGMEYPMATLITGERSLISLVGVSVHELMHSWYQMMLATNEAQYAWMDEGFTSFASSHVMNHLKSKGFLPGFEPVDDPVAGSMTGYRNFAQTPYEEALTTHADHFRRNQAYGIAAYVKGAVYLNQLEYIIGNQAFDKTLLSYYDQWKYKHPDALSFLRVAERESGIVLDWYHEKWVNTIDKINYSIDTVNKSRKNTVVELSNNGRMMMPIDLLIKTNDGKSHIYHIPLHLMRGEKIDEGLADSYHVLQDWKWTHRTYNANIDIPMSQIQSITIDGSNRLADINLEDNKWTAEELRD